eukprot:9504018-Pyramimonas_sp.AAC.4
MAIIKTCALYDISTHGFTGETGTVTVTVTITMTVTVTATMTVTVNRLPLTLRVLLSSDLFPTRSRHVPLRVGTYRVLPRPTFLPRT